MFEVHIIFGGLGKTQASSFGMACITSHACIAGSGMFHNVGNMAIWLKGGAWLYRIYIPNNYQGLILSLPSCFILFDLDLFHVLYYILLICLSPYFIICKLGLFSHLHGYTFKWTILNCSWANTKSANVRKCLLTSHLKLLLCKTVIRAPFLSSFSMFLRSSLNQNVCFLLVLFYICPFC